MRRSFIKYETYNKSIDVRTGQNKKKTTKGNTDNYKQTKTKLKILWKIFSPPKSLETKVKTLTSSIGRLESLETKVKLFVFNRLKMENNIG